MVKALRTFGDRLLGRVVPKTQASACLCWYTNCPGGGVRECCKIGGHLYCEPCE